MPTNIEKPQSALENINFRIDSTGWAEKIDAHGVRYLENPAGDITELIEGEHAGEQFFSFDAALRETSIAGKRVPTKEEWGNIIRTINPSIDPDGSWQEDVSVREALGLNLPGYYYRDSSSDERFYLGPFGSYWSSSSDGTYGYLAHFSATRIIPAGLDDKLVGVLVRCLSD